MNSRSDPRDGKSYVVWFCPECGEQATNYPDDPDRRPTTYCLNHEDESGRTERPEHEPMVFMRESRGLLAGTYKGRAE